MKKTSIIAACALTVSAVSANAQVLLAGWDFANIDGAYNVENIDSNYSDVTGDLDNFGSPNGVLLLDGTNGSTDFTEQFFNTFNAAVYNPADLTQNSAISTRFGENLGGNSQLQFANGFADDASGSTVVFALGGGFIYDSVELTYAAGLGGDSTNVNVQWSFSTDGVNFAPILTDAITGADQLGSTLTTGGAVSEEFYFAATFGTIPVDGTIALDNIQITGNATVVPEPSTYAMIMAGAAGLVVFARRRLKK